ncbi:MAG: AAA family ATPase [Acidilobaceae archaeon]|jgi:MoxR-like ATPase
MQRKIRKRIYVPHKLQLIEITDNPMLIYEIYGMVLLCIFSKSNNKTKNDFTKKEVTECVTYTLNSIQFYEDSKKKIRDLYAAFVYNDLRRLGVISVGHSENWRDDEKARLTDIGKFLKECVNKISEPDKLGALIFYLCNIYGNKVPRVEALVCYNIWKKIKSYNIQILYKKATDYVEKQYIKICHKPSHILHNISTFDFSVIATLLSGKNVLLIGMPGIGKTGYLTTLLRRLGVSYEIHTAHAEWTSYDVIGGPTLKGHWRPGFLTLATQNCRSSLKENGKPHWVIIDEINRADLDRALGEFFTLLDVEHRDNPIKIMIDEKINNDIYVPYAFRVLGTLNSYDRALLYKLGYALRRRFAVIDYERFSQTSYNDVENKFKEKLNELTKQNCDNLVKLVDESATISTLQLAKEEENDYVVLFRDFYQKITKMSNISLIYRIDDTTIDLKHLLYCLLESLQVSLGKIEDCEICPLRIAPGIIADALRYLIVLYILCNYLSDMEPDISSQICSRPASWAFFYDFAFATFILPQLDALAEYLRIEEIRQDWQKALDEASKTFSKHGLKISAEYLVRISKGFNVP